MGAKCFQHLVGIWFSFGFGILHFRAWAIESWNGCTIFCVVGFTMGTSTPSFVFNQIDAALRYATVQEQVKK